MFFGFYRARYGPSVWLASLDRGMNGGIAKPHLHRVAVYWLRLLGSIPISVRLGGSVILSIPTIFLGAVLNSSFILESLCLFQVFAVLKNSYDSIGRKFCPFDSP